MGQKNSGRASIYQKRLINKIKCKRLDGVLVLNRNLKKKKSIFFFFFNAVEPRASSTHAHNPGTTPPTPEKVFLKQMGQYKNGLNWASEMAQWIKVFVAKPENLSLIPEFHSMEGENGLPEVTLWPHACAMSHMCMHAHVCMHILYKYMQFLKKKTKENKLHYIRHILSNFRCDIYWHCIHGKNVS